MNKKKYFFIAVLLLAYLSYRHSFAAENDQWQRMVNRFMLPLTYPVHNKSDFGRETGRSDRLLLIKYKPDIYIAPGGYKPMDFYRQYLPMTQLLDENGRVVIKSPDRDDLKANERTRGCNLEYTGSMSSLQSGSPVGYGQVIRERVRFRTGGTISEKPMTFLRYNFVFPASGLPIGLPWYKELGVSILGDKKIWHLLDIHGAIYIVFNGDITIDNTLNQQVKPVALILAQHNYHRTYLLNQNTIGRNSYNVAIGFAERSNEPYPAPLKTPEFHHASDTPRHMDYILAGINPALTTGEDKVFGPNSGGTRIDYKLLFLPDKDPLYTSWIPLGNKLKLFHFFKSWYRQAPPGMDLRTWPRLKEYGELMQFWYLNDNMEDAVFMKENISSFYDVNFDKIINRNGAQLFHDLYSG